jgi:hypothetical protein
VNLFPNVEFCFQVLTPKLDFLRREGIGSGFQTNCIFRFKGPGEWLQTASAGPIDPGFYSALDSYYFPGAGENQSDTDRSDKVKTSLSFFGQTIIEPVFIPGKCFLPPTFGDVLNSKFQDFLLRVKSLRKF